MKKIIALLLALTMLLSLAACGKKVEEEPEKPEAEFEESSDEKSLLWEEEEEPAEEEPAEEEPAEEEPAEEEPAEEEPSEDEPAEEEPVEDEPAEEPAEEETQFAGLGEMEGGTYWNDDLGFGCELDSEWVFFTEEQVAEMNQLAIDAYDDEAIREQLSKANMFYDMAAQRVDGMGMLQVVVENIGIVYGAILTEEQYLDISMPQLETQLPAAGYTNLSMEKVTVEFAGRECIAASVYGEVNGVAIYQLLVPIKVGTQIALYSA